jgi:hypothetical protein
MPDLATLKAMIADLDGYIDRRAHDIAVPLVAQAEADAMAQVLAAERDAERWKDLNDELRRRLKPLQRQADEAAEARDTLARALGHHPVGLLLPGLITEAAERLRPEGKPVA